MSIIDDYKNSDDSRKFEIMQEIEFEEFPEKWELLKLVIENKEDYDLARLEALKILEIANVPQPDLSSFCDLLVTVIKTDEDYDVKNYAVIASKNFINDSEELREVIIKLVVDPKEDIDIRHNAYDAVLSFFDVPRKKSVLEKLAADDEMGKFAKKDLAAFENS
jgi:hypothetical protein